MRFFRTAPLILFLAFVAIPSRVAAQGQLSATQDPAQHQEWGHWRVMNPQYPRIVTRAKCDYDVQVDGKWTSWWGFQIRNEYQQEATDYVFSVEYSDTDGTNKQSARGVVTAKYEGIYSGGTPLWGTCGQHPLPNALHIHIYCAVPSGQDLPCLSVPQGNKVAAAKPSDEDAALNGSGIYSASQGSMKENSRSSRDSNSSSGVTGSIWACDGTIDWFSYAGGPQEVRIPGPWKISLYDGGTFTNENQNGGDSGHYWAVGEDEHWTQNGNQVTWNQSISHLQFSGVVSGKTMTLTVRGTEAETANSTGTLSCKRSGNASSVRYYYCQIQNTYLQHFGISGVFARPVSISTDFPIGRIEMPLQWLRTCGQPVLPGASRKQSNRLRTESFCIRPRSLLRNRRA